MFNYQLFNIITMKRVTSVGAAFALILSVSCKENKQKVTQQSEKVQPETEVVQTSGTTFSNETVSSLFNNYQELRAALVQSDAEQVQAIAAKIDNEVTAQQASLKSTTTAMAQESAIEKQRVLFSGLTEKMEPMFKESLASGTMYKQFCPMAFEGKGGYWVSTSEDIKNPYYGDKMLTCGKVVEVIQ